MHNTNFNTLFFGNGDSVIVVAWTKRHTDELNRAVHRSYVHFDSYNSKQKELCVLTESDSTSTQVQMFNKLFSPNLNSIESAQKT